MSMQKINARQSMVKKLGVVFIVLMVSGCAAHFNFAGLKMVKAWTNNQKASEAYLAKQRTGFLLLAQDIRGNALEKGIPKRELILHYGEPVFCQGIGGKQEKCLYRDPTKFSRTDKAYLFFNEDAVLLSWELIPYEE
ncbi:MAG: hypothetical protein A2Y00_05670 [Omnitrophica WOR_2 bacterium GWF2_43_52]|nr:MAG: hypothetical protein A2062_02540 [Omnitrophica WOR_2 bacterium GWA2_44_7]OGX20589.1 MAG: hypothetical protein A2Y00_05670 [Omnitrophica WOR_2 bacterium GWF2_43_52]HAH21593.1 hypothetical protein [Candidatus Omnitrophota bacterium]HBG64187.1 hypothetical protein [Candidatus Omnitrophota bacterium]